MESYSEEERARHVDRKNALSEIRWDIGHVVLAVLVAIASFIPFQGFPAAHWLLWMALTVAAVAWVTINRGRAALRRLGLR